jgi:hypothetical protein
MYWFEFVFLGIVGFFVWHLARRFRRYRERAEAEAKANRQYRMAVFLQQGDTVQELERAEQQRTNGE